MKTTYKTSSQIYSYIIFKFNVVSDHWSLLIYLKKNNNIDSSTGNKQRRKEAACLKIILCLNFLKFDLDF